MRRLFLATALAASIGSFGCSSSSGGSPAPGGDGGADGAGACVPYDAGPSSALQAPTTSFKDDVMPVFALSCGFVAGCHDNPSGQPLEYLGAPTDAGGLPSAALIQQVYAGIVGTPTIEDPSMPFVTAGDPSRSFVMRKLDDDLCALEHECAANNALYQQYASKAPSFTSPCGIAMPSGLPLLEQTQLDTIRRWIAQGALNN